MSLQIEKYLCKFKLWIQLTQFTFIACHSRSFHVVEYKKMKIYSYTPYFHRDYHSSTAQAQCPNLQPYRVFCLTVCLVCLSDCLFVSHSVLDLNSYYRYHSLLLSPTKAHSHLNRLKLVSLILIVFVVVYQQYR